MLTFVISMLVLFGGYAIWNSLQPAETEKNESSEVSSLVSEPEVSVTEESQLESEVFFSFGKPDAGANVVGRIMNPWPKVPVGTTPSCYQGMNSAMR